MLARRLCLVVLTLTVLAQSVPARAATTQALPGIDVRAAARRVFGADADWYAGNVPFFESSDPELNRVYAYRWKLFKAHLRDLGQRGYVVTEFLDDVGWQLQPYATLNDATAFHIYEGRWLRDRRYIGDYIEDMVENGGNDRHFSESIADAVYARYLADGDAQDALRHLKSLELTYQAWDDHYDPARRLYWIEPLLDATEYSIASIDASGGKDGFRGGEAFRPSINSYMFANARAISHLAAMAGDTGAARTYAAKAADLRRHIEADLWSPSLEHFVDRYKVDNAFVRAWEPIRGRELVGYTPWTFGLPDDHRFDVAWRHLLAPTELGGAFGLRTAEPSYPDYMRQYRFDSASGGRECQWNGPSWPFQTTQALLGLANLLHAGGQTVASRADYLRLLRQYARQHERDGRLDLQEDYDPDTGHPIVGLARSHHYNHSGFADLIITGLVGLEPRADDVLEVDPLVPVGPDASQGLSWFALVGVPYHGHLVSVSYDADGRHYGHGAGLQIYVDGTRVAAASSLNRLVAPLPRRPAPPATGLRDLAVSLKPDSFPRVSASVDTDHARQAVDGRTWFFDEAPNGWTAKQPAWLALDFGQPTYVGSAELNFSSSLDFAPPSTFRIQAWTGNGWRDVYATRYSATVKANGPTRVAFPGDSVSRIRLLIRPQAARPTRLVEFKLFGTG